MKNYIKPELKVYKVRIESLLVEAMKMDSLMKVMQKFMTILSLMRKMVMDILVASVFGTTKTLKIE